MYLEVVNELKGDISLSDEVRCPAADFDVKCTWRLERKSCESFLVMSENPEGHELSTTAASKESKPSNIVVAEDNNT